MCEYECNLLSFYYKQQKESRVKWYFQGHNKRSYQVSITYFMRSTKQEAVNTYSALTLKGLFYTHVKYNTSFIERGRDIQILHSLVLLLKKKNNLENQVLSVIFSTTIVVIMLYKIYRNRLSERKNWEAIKQNQQLNI